MLYAGPFGGSDHRRILGGHVGTGREQEHLVHALQSWNQRGRVVQIACHDLDERPMVGDLGWVSGENPHGLTSVNELAKH